MNLFNAYSQGFKETGKNLRVLILLFAINFVLAILAIKPLMNLITDGFGNSLAVTELFHGFNYIVINDFLAQNKHLYTFVTAILLVIIPLYWLLSVFFSGGILHTLNRNSYTLTTFFNGAVANFLRFLAVSLTFIILQVLFALAVFGILSSTIENFSNTANSEISIFWYVFSFFISFSIISLFLQSISDYTKCYLMLNASNNILKAIWRSLVFVVKHFLNTFFLKLLLSLTPLPVFYIWYKITYDMAGATWLGLIVLFVLQQTFVFFRVFMHVWSYASVLEFYSHRFLLAEFNSIDKKSFTNWNNAAADISEEKKVSAVPIQETQKEEDVYMQKMDEEINKANENKV